VAWEAAYNMLPNPKLAQLPAGEIRRKAEQFNRSYAELLDQLHLAFNGQRDVLVKSVGSMFELKYLAEDLIRNPIGDGQWHAGPTFEMPQ
jgi:hypothetical protein